MTNNSIQKTTADNNYLSANIPHMEQFLEQSQMALYGDSNTINNIITRGTSEKLGELKILNEEQLKEIAQYNEEINRATTIFGRSQSGYMNYLMTVSAFTPLRNAQQLLAEIEGKRSALRENIYKQKKQVVELKQKEEAFNNLLLEFKEIEAYLETLDPIEYTETIGEFISKAKRKKINYKKRYDLLKYEIPKKKIELEELQAQLADSRIYVEGALRTLLQHQKAYNSIIEHFNLHGWDEEDYEKEEARYHVTTAFAQALEDTCSGGGVIQKGDLIYMRQIGIHPLVATYELRKHMQEVEAAIQSDMRVNQPVQDHCEIMIDFLNRMADKYADSCQKLLKNKGLCDYYMDDTLYKDRNKNN